MSGITPLLDTLLHQVLGKRVDTATPERQPAAVKPLVPAQAVQRVRSDSRLNPQSTAVAESTGKQRTASPATAAPPSEDAPVQSRLSQAARQLSDLMHRQPEKADPIRPPAPLMPASQGDAPVLATKLQQSIEYSGLFYESHLARWASGGRERAQVEQELQMHVWQNAGADTAEATESLHRLLWQQLEALAQQRVRWAGDVWPGFFAELSIQPCFSEESSSQQGKREEQGREDTADYWQADLVIPLGELGDLEVCLSMYHDSLKVKCRTPSGALATLVSEHSRHLHQRLQTVSTGEIQLDLEVTE